MKLPIVLAKEDVKFEYIPHYDPIGQLEDGGMINLEVKASYDGLSASTFRYINAHHYDWSGLVEGNDDLEHLALDNLNKLLSDFIARLNNINRA